MSDQSRPNLFHYATSELSQDAFICWLAAWADPKYKDADTVLHEIARSFIASMIQKVKSDYDVSTLKAVKVRRQVGKLDVLIEINKPDSDEKAPGELAILIEDKTHTFDHGTQLADYHKHVVGLGYTEDKMIPLYFKTSYQSRFDKLGEKYKTYIRKDFFEVLRKGKEAGLSNAIFTDFLEHLENMEYVVNQYEKKNIALTEGPDKWDGNDWRGLFMALYEKFKEDDNANWGYVPNASGGFFGFWWHFQVSTNEDYWSYLQWENRKLCFKIGFSDKFVQATDWKSQAEAIKLIWSSSLQEENSDLSSKGTKVGKTMTVAKIDDALHKKEDGNFYLDQMIAKMNEAQGVLERVRRKLA